MPLLNGQRMDDLENSCISELTSLKMQFLLFFCSVNMLCIEDPLSVCPQYCQ